MAKAKTKRRSSRNGGVKIPVSIVAGFMPGLIKVWEAWPSGGSAAAREAGRIYTGVDFWEGNFAWRRLWYGTIPIIAGAIIHRVVGGMLGVNRAIGRAGIPFIRI